MAICREIGQRLLKYFLGYTVFLVFLLGLLQFNFPSVPEITDFFLTKFYDRQIETFSLEGEDPIKQGWLFFNLGRLSESRTIMEELLKRGENISALYCLGLIDLKENNPAAAVQNLEKVTVLAPKHVPTLIALGKSYYQMKYFGPAREKLEKAVINEPANSEARLWLGKTYLALHRTEKARLIFTTIAGEPEGPEAAALIKNLP